MKNTITEQALRGYRFSNIIKHNEYTIYQLADHYGSGEMTCYDITPGIQVSYNNMDMDSCFHSIAPVKEFLEIDYCLEGCYEVELENNTFSFLGKGDLCVTNLSRQICTGSRLPQKHYRGITILLELETAQRVLDSDFPQGQINLKQISSRLCSGDQSLLIKSRHDIDRILSDLYQVDTQIRLPYLWLKVMELLLFLCQLDSSHIQQPYRFSADVSKAAQEVYQHITTHPFSRETISELAVTFGISESSMKRCFKSLSGHSIGTFMKIQKMEAAAKLLATEPGLSIREVAETAGYENQSKFTAAFKSVLKTTPSTYRRKAL